MSAFIFRNENGFLKSVKFNKKALKALPIYTQEKSQALIMYPSFTYVLKHIIHDLNFLAGEVIKLESLNFTDSIKIYDLAFPFVDYCVAVRRLSYINNVIKSILSTQHDLISFFKSADFKQCGALTKKCNVQFEAITEKARSTVSYDHCGEYITITFKSGSVEDWINVFLVEDRHQSIFNKKPITVAQYIKAKKSLAKKSEQKNMIENDIYQLKNNFYFEGK